MTSGIPTEAFVVRTRNSIYRFGPAEKDGVRTVSRDENPLNFDRCKIWKLEKGGGMTLDCVGGPYPHWYTSTVVSIEQVH